MNREQVPVYARYAEVLPNGRGRVYDGHEWVPVRAETIIEMTRRAVAEEVASWHDDEEPVDD